MYSKKDTALIPANQYGLITQKLHFSHRSFYNDFHAVRCCSDKYWFSYGWRQNASCPWSQSRLFGRSGA